MDFRLQGMAVQPGVVKPFVASSRSSEYPGTTACAAADDIDQAPRPPAAECAAAGDASRTGLCQAMQAIQQPLTDNSQSGRAA
jgi:hypothetical protein